MPPASQSACAPAAGRPPHCAKTEAPGASGAKAPTGLAEENSVLRRENQELRQQLLQLVAAAAPPTASDASTTLPAPFWLEAQLTHARRQVKLLSDALVVKAEITANLDTLLREMLQAQPPPPTAQVQFCRAALRRLRGVEFAEEVGREIHSAEARTRSSGRGLGAAAPARTRTVRATAPLPSNTASRSRVPPSVL